MDRSTDERNSLTGNSGLLGLSSVKPKFKPINIKAFLDMYNSDEEESEDKGKDSNSDSEGEDIQSLPEDTDECLSTMSEGNNVLQKNKLQTETFSSRLQESEQKDTVVDNGEKKHCPIFKHFTENLSMDERPTRAVRETVSSDSGVIIPNPGIDGNSISKLEVVEKSKEQTSGEASSKMESGNYLSAVRKTVSSDSILESREKIFYSKERRSVQGQSVTNHSSILFPSQTLSSSLKSENVLERSSSKHSLPGGRRSNVKFEFPEASTEPPVRRESTEEALIPERKFDSREGTFFSKEKNFQSDNSNLAEIVSSVSSVRPVPVTPVRQLVTDTPMKNNPPHGSQRPTPSTSHRSIFQTPRNSELRQEYSKNHVHTPATIFGNWSTNHMSQTPLGNRLTSCDSISRNQGTKIVSQKLTHDSQCYRTKDDKKGRTPLGESISSVQKNQHDQNDALSSRFNTESSSTLKNSDNQIKGSLEQVGDKFSIKPEIERDSKENKHPRIAPKSSVEEEVARRKIPMDKKNSVTVSSKEIVDENILKQKISNVPSYEQPGRFPLGNSIVSSSGTSEKNQLPERQNNVQVSVPSRVRRSNQGQIINVKGKDYLILGNLGEGMSGQVLRVQDVENLQLRAIKVVDLSRLDKDCAQGCLQEISMLYKLQAPCIVKMFDYEIKYPMVHVVLEMGDTDFKSLLNSMSEKSRLPLTMILYYWTEMLTAVKHIHDNGVIHSDLKPANFLLVRGRLKLIDFGIASSINADMTSVVKNNPIGTLNYISPEALMDVSGNSGDSPNRNVKYKISFKSDVWSLGCILYSLVYGYTPFHNIRTQWGKVSAITNPHPKISFALPTGNDVEPIPPILIDVMKKCLQHDPKARPTVGQLLQIPYIPIRQNPPKPVPDVPANILMKIKFSLTDSEWRQFTEIMEARRSQ